MNLFNDACIDGTSTMNDCILNLFKKIEKKNNSDSMPRHPHWCNNVIVVKRKPGTREHHEYQDISPADATEVIKFLYMYTAEKSLILY